MDTSGGHPEVTPRCHGLTNFLLIELFIERTRRTTDVIHSCY